MREEPKDIIYRKLKERFEESLIRYLASKFGHQIQPLEPIVHDAIEEVAEILITEPARIGYVRGYLMKMVYHEALKQVKDRERIKPIDSAHEQIAEESNRFFIDLALKLGLPENAHKADICHVLAEKLGEPCQTILKLYLSGKKLEDIAIQVGMKYNSAKSKKSQCINNLKTLISKL